MRVELHKPPLKRRSWVRGGLSKPKVQPILSWAICPVFLHVGSVDVCAMCWWEISNVCSSCLTDLPHTYYYTCFYLTKKNKRNRQARALPAWTPRSLKLIYYYYCSFFVIYYYYYYYYYKFLFYFICSPNFYHLA